MTTVGIVANIFQTKSGTWKVRWREEGCNKQKTFTRKMDALNLQAKLFNGEARAKEIMPVKFQDFIQIWKSRHCNVNVEPSTAVDYKYKVDKNILPYFKGRLLSSIDEDDIIKFKEWLTVEKKFHPVTVGNHIRMIKLIFRCACTWRDEEKNHYLFSNPTLNVREPRKMESDINFWTTQEIKTFLEYTKERAPKIYEIVLLATSTGLRRGELHQLQPDCLDFENKIITVKRSFSFLSRKVQPTKGKSLRRIPMNDEVYKQLLKYKDIPPEQRIFEGVDIGAFHKFLRRWCEKSGVKVVGLHDLRDTFASSLVKSGMKIKVIQYLLGHVDISVTERYMHLDPSDVNGSTDCLLTGIDD